MKAGTVNEAKLRWAELDDDDGEDLDFLLPPKEVIGPDENGIKKVIEYKFNEQGNKVKITRTVQTRKLAKARLSKKAVERRSWAKFGEAVNGNVGDSRTVVSTEEIKLERPKGMVSSSFVFGLLFALIGCCALGFLRMIIWNRFCFLELLVKQLINKKADFE